MRIKRHLRRPPRPIPPTAVQAAYWAELKKMIRFAGQLVRERLIANLPEYVERPTAYNVDQWNEDARRAEMRDPDHEDAAHAPSKRTSAILASIARTFEARYPQPKLETIAEKIAAQVDAHQKRQLQRTMRALTGVDLSSMRAPRLQSRIKQFTAENVALIKTVPRTYFAQIEKRTLEAMRNGERHEELAKDLEERLGVAESRAQLIARDQVLKFNGELNGARQQDLGIEKYIWRTAGDERVRDSHDERDGEVYTWGDPPGDPPDDPATGGEPGQAIRCRCYADPILPDDVVAAITGE